MPRWPAVGKVESIGLFVLLPGGLALDGWIGVVALFAAAAVC